MAPEEALHLPPEPNPPENRRHMPSGSACLPVLQQWRKALWRFWQFPFSGGTKPYLNDNAPHLPPTPGFSDKPCFSGLACKRLFPIPDRNSRRIIIIIHAFGKNCKRQKRKTTVFKNSMAERSPPPFLFYRI